MISNELAIQLPVLDVIYTPLLIKIEGEAELKAAMKKAAERYQNLVVTEDTAKDVRKVRANLNKIVNQLDAKRKEVKRNYNEPIKDMESRIKSLQSVVKPVINQIDDGLHELDEQHKAERLEFVKSQIAEMAPNYGVEPSEIPIDKRWLNKTMSNKELLGGIGGVMKQISTEHELLKSQTAELKNYAKKLGVPPEGWISELEMGFDLDEIEKQMTTFITHKRARIAEEKAAQVKVSGKTVNKETGEVIQSKHYQLMIEATEEKAEALKQFLKNNGYEYEMEVI